MIARISGTFRTQSFGQPLNFDDSLQLNAAGGGVSQWTEGATILDQVPITQSAATQKLTVLAYSVTGYLQMFDSSSTSDFLTRLGKLGKIVAGIMNMGSPTTGQSGPPVLPWVQPVQPLPQDATLVTDLWNPASDPMPPIVSGLVTNGLLVSATNILPEPVELATANLLIGMWALPSLSPQSFSNQAAACHLQMYGGQYTLTTQSDVQGQGPVNPPA